MSRDADRDNDVYVLVAAVFAVLGCTQDWVVLSTFGSFTDTVAGTQTAMGKVALVLLLVAVIALGGLLALRDGGNPRPYLLVSTWASVIAAGSLIYAFLVRGNDVAGFLVGFWFTMGAAVTTAGLSFTALQKTPSTQ